MEGGVSEIHALRFVILTLWSWVKADGLGGLPETVNAMLEATEAEMMEFYLL